PFEESKLLECSLQLLERGLLVSLQDLGAAGLTSSASEMASKGEVGIDLDVAKVPLREGDMQPFEIMVSESQERMLCVVAPARVDDVLALCARWEVGGTVIGSVTDTGRMRVFDGGELVGDMPVTALVDDCPLYDLAPQRPSAPIYDAPAATLARDASPREVLLALLSCPNIASRRPLFEQYDSIVQSRTVRRPEQADAAVLAIRPEAATRVAGADPDERAAEDGTGVTAADAAVLSIRPDGGADAPPTAGEGVDSPRPAGSGGPVPALAVSIDCNGRRVAADPYRGTVEAVLECASNLACVGAEPLGATNNLNFGNPERAHVAWQLTESVRGLGDACRALGAPIVGGNVSLYNETSSGPIYPTPVIGMVGRLPDAARAGRLGFAREGDAIALAGPFAPALDASELAKLRGEALPDGLGASDIDAVRAAQALVREAVRSGSISSAHDIAEGGIAIALAECCLAGGLGARVVLDDVFSGAPVVEALFGESPGGFLLSGAPGTLRALAAAATAAAATTTDPGSPVAVRLIGAVGGDLLRIATGGETVEISLDELAQAHGALEKLFN
ncbi:MAG TPA: AIR synthase-related protein, partial [Solirubrobacteraceae bacterium]|nr:AIR synthase-related protein [Solirubrobacteraceae bacterium]